MPVPPIPAKSPARAAALAATSAAGLWQPKTPAEPTAAVPAAPPLRAPPGNPATTTPFDAEVDRVAAQLQRLAPTIDAGGARTIGRAIVRDYDLYTGQVRSPESSFVLRDDRGQQLPLSLQVCQNGIAVWLKNMVREDSVGTSKRAKNAAFVTKSDDGFDVAQIVKLSMQMPSEQVDRISYRTATRELRNIKLLAGGAGIAETVSVASRYNKRGQRKVAIYQQRYAGDLFHVTSHPGFLRPAVQKQLMKDCALGVDTAHARKLLHLDIKPENFLYRVVDNVTRAKLTDFGLSKLQHADGTNPRSTGGTASFYSPDFAKRAQKRLDAGQDVDQTERLPSDDIYGLGLVFHELRNKYAPHFSPASNASFDEAIAHLKDLTVESMGLGYAVPGSIDAVIEGMLDPDETKRPKASELDALIEAATF